LPTEADQTGVLEALQRGVPTPRPVFPTLVSLSTGLQTHASLTYTEEIGKKGEVVG